MDMAPNFGQMVPDTRVCGATIKPMARENLYMPMETSTRASGSTIRQRELVPIRTRTELTTKDNGRTTSNTDMEWSLGQTVLDMRASTKMERKRVKAD